MDKLTYIGNENVKLICEVNIDVTDVSKPDSHIKMVRSDGTSENLSVDDVDTVNNAVIHNSTDDDFTVEGTYQIQPYLVLKDSDGNVTGKYLCDADTFFVKGSI